MYLHVFSTAEHEKCFLYSRLSVDVFLCVCMCVNISLIIYLGAGVA
jgi:hypothetical protein